MSNATQNNNVRIFTAPMSAWSESARRVATATGVALAAMFAYAVGRLGPYFAISDAMLYVQIARGESASVMQPAASRQLGPAVVRLLGWVLHWPVERAFVLQGVISLLVLLAIVYVLAVRTAAPRWLLVALALIPFWPQLFHGLALPDLWYAALLAVFLLLLERQHFLLAALMMFPLMLSRESTSLVLLCFLIAGWKQTRWLDKLAAIAAAVAGTAIVQHLAAHSPGNREHLPESIYIAAKLPWNFMRDVLGIAPWSNVYPLLCQTPVWQHALHLGPVRAIGVCGFDSHLPLGVVLDALMTFGMLPLLLVFVWWRVRKNVAVKEQGQSLLLYFSLLYGAVSFVLAPALGVWFYRLYGYGWPLFLVALPLLFNELDSEMLTRESAGAGVAFLGLHVCVCALAYWFVYWPRLGVLVVLYAAGFFLLRWWFREPSSGPFSGPFSGPDAGEIHAPSMVKSS